MQFSTLLLLLAVAAASVACVSAIELESHASSAAAPAAFEHDMTRVCAQRCSAPTDACATRCSDVSTTEKAEYACRKQCTARLTKCMRECIAHPVEPEHQPRAVPRPPSQNTGFGPETVKNWAGYVTVNGTTPDVKRHLWYWFFESRNQPTTDPLLIWLTGGPGCSSLVALFAENGPYIIADDLSLSLNPFSWNTNASAIWIDQPVGTGYSYGDKGDWGVTTEAEIADNLYQFLQGFFQQYPEYSQLPFFIAGESYAGHYVPAFANRVLQGNAEGNPANAPVNLQAIAIGNGLVDPAVQYTQYAPFTAANKVLNPLAQSIMQGGIPGCEYAISLCAQNSTLGREACMLAFSVCNNAELLPYQISGLNPYDYRIKCEVPPLCYNFSNVDAFLAQPQVAAALGVTGIQWVSCNRMVDMELVYAGDWMLNLATVVPYILASNVRIVVYSGECDFICNWYGGLAWTNALVWPGQQAFVNAQNTTWTYNGEEAGSSRTAQGFSFVRVKDAGHMVPYNQPERALDLIRRVISGAPFDESTPAYPVDALDSANLQLSN